MSAAERVAAGAALLDRVKPGWRDLIDTDILDVRSINTCPLSQLFGGYASGLEALGMAKSDEAEQAALGFERDHAVDYAELAAAWLLEIRRPTPIPIPAPIPAPLTASRYGADFDRLADTWAVLENEHDKMHPDRDVCGGVGGCSLMAAAYDLAEQMRLGALVSWRRGETGG